MQTGEYSECSKTFTQQKNALIFKVLPQTFPNPNFIDVPNK